MTPDLYLDKAKAGEPIQYLQDATFEQKWIDVRFIGTMSTGAWVIELPARCALPAEVKVVPAAQAHLLRMKPKPPFTIHFDREWEVWRVTKEGGYPPVTVADFNQQEDANEYVAWRNEKAKEQS